MGIEAVVDENGQKVNQYLYELFGATRPETTEQVPQPYRYAGGYQDPTLQYHLGARYLEPYVGRFTHPDPSGQELNPYLYATGDPTNMIDPTGLASMLQEITAQAAGAAAAAAVTSAFPELGLAAAGAADQCTAGALTAAFEGKSATDVFMSCLRSSVIGVSVGTIAGIGRFGLRVIKEYRN